MSQHVLDAVFCTSFHVDPCRSWRWELFGLFVSVTGVPLELFNVDLNYAVHPLLIWFFFFLFNLPLTWLLFENKFPSGFVSFILCLCCWLCGFLEIYFTLDFHDRGLSWLEALNYCYCSFSFLLNCFPYQGFTKITETTTLHPFLAIILHLIACL